MRKYGKVDANQAAIIQGLLDHGRTVQTLADVGGGCPDLVVGHNQKNYLLEVKDGAKPPSHRKLTYAQQVWHGTWAGHVAVVETLEQALDETE